MRENDKWGLWENIGFWRIEVLGQRKRGKGVEDVVLSEGKSRSLESMIIVNEEINTYQQIQQYPKGIEQWGWVIEGAKTGDKV